MKRLKVLLLSVENYSPLLLQSNRESARASARAQIVKETLFDWKKFQNIVVLVLLNHYHSNERTKLYFPRIMRLVWEYFCLSDSSQMSSVGI